MEWRNGIPRVAQVVTRTAGDAAQVEDPTVAWPERLPDLVVGYVDDRWQQVGEWTVFERATRTLWRCDFGDGTVSDHSTIAAWYEDGTPKLRGEEWGMELGGVWREWHRNGQLALEGPAPNGPFRRYDASGALIESSTKPPTIDVPFGRYWLANESRRVLLR
ncbi:MAG: hypothetical protein L6Q99_14365 [Planctomycetes bacterium]|nr:hypothetical protein [Planctomycetota bacterium]